ncbi:PREDICTED: uncharacterized protein LOC104594361 isoform X1 [Nelumbo nucifera]|uniref:Uncharacterized protein LOC104594361 isoform X1 n=1 Tax=Nelumbo nucifera TaxID=4432 RepID=A0A1U8Q2C4_NELNU|nr:PREDICTED: uncharacterized protein LOC104594361 isoform X1 [Nelumbo nucifera]
MDQKKGLSSSPTSKALLLLTGEKASSSGAASSNWAWVLSKKKKVFSSERHNPRFKKHLLTVETGSSLIPETENQVFTDTVEICATEEEGSSSIGSVDLEKAKSLGANESLHILGQDDLDVSVSAQKMYSQCLLLSMDSGSTEDFIEERQGTPVLKLAPSSLEQHGTDRGIEEQELPWSLITELSTRGQLTNANSDARLKTILVEHNGNPQSSSLEGLAATQPLRIAPQEFLTSSHNHSGNIVNSFYGTDVGFLPETGTSAAQLDAAAMVGRDKGGKEQEEVVRGRESQEKELEMIWDQICMFLEEYRRKEEEIGKGEVQEGSTKTGDQSRKNTKDESIMGKLQNEELERIWGQICALLEEYRQKEESLEENQDISKRQNKTRTVLRRSGTFNNRRKKKISDVERLISDIEENLEFSGRGERRKASK